MRSGASTSDFIINEGGFEKEVDKKKLKRFIKGKAREVQDILEVSPAASM